MTQPAPFHLVRHEGRPTVATNGATRLMCLDAGGVVKLRRGIRGVVAGPVVERVLPLLNQLAGELLANSTMAPAEVAARLHALQALCQPVEPQNLEWAYAELDGVRVYVDGQDVVVTRQDLSI
jgi:hypothetical protein